MLVSTLSLARLIPTSTVRGTLPFRVPISTMSKPMGLATMCAIVPPPMRKTKYYISITSGRKLCLDLLPTSSWPTGRWVKLPSMPIKQINTRPKQMPIKQVVPAVAAVQDEINVWRINTAISPTRPWKRQRSMSSRTKIFVVLPPLALLNRQAVSV